MVPGSAKRLRLCSLCRSGVPLLDLLNDQQKKAVTIPSSRSAMVFAGAGSGKTHVLAHRIAWLCENEKFSPRDLLALTFTNKAAREMRTRVEQTLGRSVGDLWIGTFHGICHRLLKRHREDLGLASHFLILDASDQRQFLRRVMANLGVDTQQDYVKEVQYFINDCKEQGWRAKSVPEQHLARRREHLRIYAAYENGCRQSDLVDFAELLLRSYEMFSDCEGILRSYRSRFRCLLVDEFQDTNQMQYKWLRRLAGEEVPLFVVGDDDQSIYGWRGADAENFNKFRRHFKDVCVQKLEQNYRSTKTILDAANHLIENNQNRNEKKLWTDGDKGEPVMVFTARDEGEEAAFVASKAQEWVDSGRKYAEAAVLYRSNAQSRVFESELLKQKIPYRIYGGLRFFERSVIKDALAYLCLLCNFGGDHFLARIINTPARGIGLRKLSDLRAVAAEHACSYWKALEILATQSGEPKYKVLKGFRQLMTGLRDAIQNQPLVEQVKLVIEKSGLLAHHRADLSETGRSNVEYLQELVNAARQAAFDNSASEDNLSPLENFLAQATLESSGAHNEGHQDCLSLMTLHSAKGLEFPLVFLVGMEEELFPHRRALNEQGGLEEERRLCYVGMTRAKESLFMSHCEERYFFGSRTKNHRSRFIAEVPGECIRDLCPERQYARGSVAGSGKFEAGETFRVELPLRLGMMVRHAKLGDGRITDFSGHGETLRALVRFRNGPSKWVLWSYGGLEMLEQGLD